MQNNSNLWIYDRKQYIYLRLCLDVNIQGVELNWVGIPILSGNGIGLQYHCNCLDVHVIGSWNWKVHPIPIHVWMHKQWNGKVKNCLSIVYLIWVQRKINRKEKRKGSSTCCLDPSGEAWPAATMAGGQQHGSVLPNRRCRAPQSTGLLQGERAERGEFHGKFGQGFRGREPLAGGEAGAAATANVARRLQSTK